MDEIFGPNGNSGRGENSAVVGGEPEQGRTELAVFTAEECMCLVLELDFLIFCVSQ